MNITDIASAINESAFMPEVAENICNMSVEYRGNRYYALCPNPGHHDREVGSFVLQSNFAYCFACNESFDAIKLVMVVLNVSWMEAARMLSDYYGLGLDFKQEANPVEPLIIPAEVFRFAGIADTASFKKLFAQDRETAFRYLAVMIAAAKNKYVKFNAIASMPAEVGTILKHRIEVLTRADAAIPKWKASDANKPLRIK